MGQGIAVAFSLAGVPVSLVDLKPRNHEDFATLEQSARAAIGTDFGFLERIGAMDASAAQASAKRIEIVPASESVAAVQQAELIFEAVPETREAKAEAFAWLSRHAPRECILASTTSTFLVTDIADLTEGAERVLNAHWLNPAHLMPLVEVSYGPSTDPAITDRLCGILEAIGKVPTRMGAAPGYVVPRIQALAMNEAARMVEEDIGTAEEIDKAIRLGIGLRFAVLGMLEFIDWGGGDILYHASNYLAGAVSEDRYQLPDIVAQNMHENRNGLRDKQGFYDYAGVDVDSYRAERLGEFVDLLKRLDLMPKIAS